MDFLLPATAKDFGAEPPTPAPTEARPPPAQPVELVVAGTRVYFDDFYREARPCIGRAVALALGDVDLAIEATDEALTRAYERWDHVSHLDRPEAWVYRVATNWALSVLRRRRRSQHRLYDPGHGDASAIADPELHAALAELDAKHRSVVVCRHLLGWSVAETAAALHLREGTVKSRLHRAMRLLQPRLSHLRTDPVATQDHPTRDHPTPDHPSADRPAEEHP